MTHHSWQRWAEGSSRRRESQDQSSRTESGQVKGVGVVGFGWPSGHTEGGSEDPGQKVTWSHIPVGLGLQDMASLCGKWGGPWSV